MKILAGPVDSPTMTTGFARVVQNLAKRWNQAGVIVDCWGIGFRGHKYKEVPYINELFPGGMGGEWNLIQNLQAFLQRLQLGSYTHVWMMQDTFMLSQNYQMQPIESNGFGQAIREVCDKMGIVSCLYFPVDAPLEPDWTEIIQAVDIPVAYTDYGRREAEKNILSYFALKKPEQAQALLGKRASLPKIEVLPHGVDTKVYRPTADRAEARRMWKNPGGQGFWLKDTDLLLLNVNAHQKRKDVVRSLEVLARLKQMGLPVKLVMHMPEMSGEFTSLELAAKQLGLTRSVDWGHHNHYFAGSNGAMSEADLCRMYNAADLYLTTTLGEGWGLGITEALASGCPVAMPTHTSCGEIYRTLTTHCGMPSSAFVMLPTEAHGVVLTFDNTRVRYRVDVEAAAEGIKRAYDAGYLRQRVKLTPQAVEWMSWDRIANKFRKLMKNHKGVEPVKEVAA